MDIRIRTHEEFQRDRVTIEITGTGAEVREVAKLYTTEDVTNAQVSEAALVAGPLQARINELEEELTRRAGIIKRLENKVEAYDTGQQAERNRADQAEARLMDGHVCTEGCSGGRHVAFVGRKELTEAEARINDLEGALKITKAGRESNHQHAMNLIADLKLEKDRANQAEARIRVLEASLNAARKRGETVTAHRIVADHKVRELEARVEELTREHQECAGNLELREQDANTFRNQRNEMARRVDNARVILSNPEVTSIRGVMASQVGVKLADAIGKALDTLG